MRKLVLIALCLSLAAPIAWATGARTKHLRLATTTSTENSGLLTILHLSFEKAHGIKVDVIAVGSGKALKLAENGDVDLVMVHAPEAERDFVSKGFGLERLPLMHNDFILLGPKTDPANVSKAHDISTAMQVLAQGKQIEFISRGDDSGTHKKEATLWKLAGIDPKNVKTRQAVGQGMGAVLQIANDKLAYTLSDRGTWLSMKNRSQLQIVFENDPALFNPYHLILVNPQRHLHINQEMARKYAEFVRGAEGQKIINTFRKSGEQLFMPDVIKS
ncbi:MAG: ABC transporter substrate-binding protein [Candidatus Eutrophobiaceae bacterium]